MCDSCGIGQRPPLFWRAYLWPSKEAIRLVWWGGRAVENRHWCSPFSAWLRLLGEEFWLMEWTLVKLAWLTWEHDLVSSLRSQPSLMGRFGPTSIQRVDIRIPNYGRWVQYKRKKYQIEPTFVEGAGFVAYMLILKWDWRLCLYGIHDDLYKPPTSVEIMLYLIYVITFIFSTTYWKEEVKTKPSVITVNRYM